MGNDEDKVKELPVDIFKNLSVEEVVETEEYKELLKQEIKEMRRQRLGRSLKKDAFEDLIGYVSTKDGELIPTLTEHFKRILEKKSDLSSTQRIYIKSLMDLVLRKWIQTKIKVSV